MQQLPSQVARGQAANLGQKQTGYDLAPIWLSERMAKPRRSIAAKECACPMANANYTNMLLHPPTLAKVALDVVR